jgi:hypothetical protein
MEYLFLLNAAIYFVLERLFRIHAIGQLLASPGISLHHSGHVMTSLLLLGIEAKSHSRRGSSTGCCPLSCVFVFASIQRQMKTFVSGLVFFAIGVYRLQQNVFRACRMTHGAAGGRNDADDCRRELRPSKSAADRWQIA